jgi:hypothetical protein
MTRLTYLNASALRLILLISREIRNFEMASSRIAGLCQYLFAPAPLCAGQSKKSFLHRFAC